MYLCFSLYIKLNSLVRRNNFEISYNGRAKNITIDGDDITIEFMQPLFTNTMLYINDCLDSFGRVLKVNDTDVTIFCMNVISPRCVIFVDDFNDKVLNYAKDISNNPLFRRGISVDYVKVIDRKNISVKTYINGVGFGFSAEGNVAAVIASNKQNYTYKTVEVQNEFGTSMVDSTKKIIKFVGQAYKLFELDL
jgi:diaminopimelate epimerase